MCFSSFDTLLWCSVFFIHSFNTAHNSFALQFSQEKRKHKIFSILSIKSPIKFNRPIQFASLLLFYCCYRWIFHYFGWHQTIVFIIFFYFVWFWPLIKSDSNIFFRFFRFYYFNMAHSKPRKIDKRSQIKNPKTTGTFHFGWCPIAFSFVFSCWRNSNFPKRTIF